MKKYVDVIDTNGEKIGSRLNLSGNKKIAILAGNYDQFNQFLEENGGSNCLQKPYNLHRNRLKTLAFYY